MHFERRQSPPILALEPALHSYNGIRIVTPAEFLAAVA